MLVKVMALIKKRDDIIFLSDVRLNTDKQSSAIHDLKKVFFNECYDFHYSSKTSSRGVGILISRKIDYRILDCKKDVNEQNFLLLKLEIEKNTLVAGAVYGPNLDNEINFYDNLADSLRELNCPSIIIGGDWNATWSTEDVTTNIDVHRMRDIPSKRRSEKLREICTNYSLTDPYRIFYPSKKEYTYVPSIEANVNRSRLDFFIVSDDLMNQCNNCTISPSLNCNLFDHKCVSLQF
jgi:exonuclease III